MSRHKNVKAMSDAITKSQNIDDEFDYYDDDDVDDSYDPDAAEQQMKESVTKAREVLGAEFSETEIRDSLWHYYYDVEKAVNYLLSNEIPCYTAATLILIGPEQKSAPATKPTPKNAKGWLNIQFPISHLQKWTPLQAEHRPIFLQRNMPGNTPQIHRADVDNVELLNDAFTDCSRRLTAAEFFADCPWLNIPADRRGDILIEPRHSIGGLLGGSSQQPPKTSKLAALAAARKKKENDKLATGSESKGTSSSVALLDKLSSRTKESVPGNLSESRPTTSIPKEELQSHDTAIPPRKYPIRRKKEDSKEAVTKAEESPPIKESHPQIAPEPVPEAPVLTSPSKFANTMIGSSDSHMVPTTASVVIPHLTSFQVFPENNAENPFAGPSPDDIVSKAQNASKGLKPKGPQKRDKAVNEVTKDLNKAKIDDGPRAKSKNLDVVAEYEKMEKKNSANFVVIGHVDAGKSTLMGRLLYDLKVVDQRTIDKLKKEAETIGKSSFAMAWVMDEQSEERERGVTIDIATHRFETSKTAFTILDAPGHQDFVPNMIAGASQADFAVLLVDASTGSFESGLRGQTKEHALLVRSIGVQRLIVAVNKLDSVDWDKSRFDEITQQTSAFLTAAGFRESNVTFIPCSGLHGDNITQRSTAASSKWYTGSLLLEELEQAATPRTYDIKGPLRMSIVEIFSGGVQFPLSTSGRLTSGNVQVGDKIVCVPSNDTGYIKAIEIGGELKDWAVAGMNATLHLSHIDPTHLKIGDVICTSNKPLIPRSSFLLKALAFEHVLPMSINVIVGRLNVQGRIETCVAKLDKASGQIIKKNPKTVKPGDVVRLRVVVTVQGGMPIEEGARVVLRTTGETVATGLVE